MAKENEKKVSGELNAEELENVAGGWCTTGGKSMPAEVKSVKKNMYSDGTYTIVTTFQDGSQAHTLFKANGEMDVAAGAKPFGR